MKRILRIWLLVAFASTAFSADAASDEVRTVSIIRLIAAPQQYAHKLVRVVGYLNIAFEGDAIYLHEEDFNRSLTANALWIDAKPEMRKELRKLSRGYVILEGVFDPSDTGHMGLFSGALNNITRADSWKVE